MRAAQEAAACDQRDAQRGQEPKGWNLTRDTPGSTGCAYNQHDGGCAGGSAEERKHSMSGSTAATCQQRRPQERNGPPTAPKGRFSSAANQAKARRARRDTSARIAAEPRVTNKSLIVKSVGWTRCFSRLREIPRLAGSGD